MHFPLLLSLLLPLAECTRLRILVPSTPSLSNPSALPPSTVASLTTTAHLLHAPLRADNTFDFRNVSAGSYLLDVHSHTHDFAPLRVDVHHSPVKGEEQEVQAWSTFRGNEWGNKGEKYDVTEVKPEDGSGEVVWMFAVRAKGKREYFVERQGCEYSPWL